MTRRLIFRQEARVDFLRAALWHEEQNPGLGDRFVADLNKVLDRIVENPFQFPNVIQDAHYALLSKFPYKVYFRIGEDMTKVLAIVHQHRTARSAGSDKEPILRVSFERSNVVIWWQRATESSARPPVPIERKTAVGPRRRWAPEVEQGMTMMDCQEGASLKAL